MQIINRINQDIFSVNGRQIDNFQLIREKWGTYIDVHMRSDRQSWNISRMRTISAKSGTIVFWTNIISRQSF